MTVAELCAILSNVPSGMRVVVDGYEGGYADLTLDRVAVVMAAINGFAGHAHYSPHAPQSEASHGWCTEVSSIEPVVLLSRQEIPETARTC